VTDCTWLCLPDCACLTVPVCVWVCLSESVWVWVRVWIRVWFRAWRPSLETEPGLDPCLDRCMYRSCTTPVYTPLYIHPFAVHTLPYCTRCTWDGVLSGVRGRVMCTLRCPSVHSWVIFWHPMCQSFSNRTSHNYLPGNKTTSLCQAKRKNCPETDIKSTQSKADSELWLAYSDLGN